MPVSDKTISTRDEFKTLLEENKSVVILKFGAEWCGPCKKIEGIVHQYFEKLPESVTCMVLDIDECFDLYAFLKSKKIVTAIPTLIAYYKGNTHYAPDEIVTGTNIDIIDMFFKNVQKFLLD